jgi:hypothetical protein
MKTNAPVESKFLWVSEELVDDGNARNAAQALLRMR